MNENRNWFFQNINKIGKPLTRCTKKKRQRIKLLKSETEVGTMLQFYINKKDYKRIH